ncbi:MAG: hypothetical protein IKT46_04450 [Clostridia bacterium]|nr:hypothetical protein [Clostridia bacterium]
MKRLVRGIIIISIITVFMLVVPLITVNTVKAEAGMAVTLLLFFAVHPVVSAAVGILAGKDIRFFWYSPILVAGLFWIFARITYDPAFPIVYSIAYLIISVLSMLITWLITKKTA